MRAHDSGMDRHGDHDAGAALHLARSAGADGAIYQRRPAAVAVEVTARSLIKVWSNGVVEEWSVGSELQIEFVRHYMFEDLRGYFTNLESQGQLLRVSDPVEVK